jgi:hypothetical protein
MTSWNVINRGRSLPAPPAEGVTAKTLDGPVGKVDGRSARATGRREQFNPRVHRNFLEAFRQALKDESARAGTTISQGYLLEMMLAAWRHERASGGPVKGLGLMLPEMTMRAAADLAKHLNLSVEAVVSDAITERMISSGLAKVNRSERRGG